MIISIDTLRADHLPAWGYRGVETPAIDALRADGIQFRNAWSHVPLTLPSHVSILTGLLPYEHGVRDNLGYSYDPNLHPSVTSPLRTAGYTTGAAVSAYVLRGATGISSAFDFYDDAITVRTGEPSGNLQRPGSSAVASAKRWISERKSRPFFFMLHLFEPHTPYEPPEPFRSRYANRYDGEIAAADALVGDFLAWLKSEGLYDKALIIVLSDHGEGLGDHGEGEHGVLLYREAIHVPLIVKLPGRARAGETVDANVELVDVAPTIAEVAGVEFSSASGRSLLGGKTPARPVYSETLYPRLHFGWSDLRSLVDGSLHYVEGPSPELFDLRADAAERTNIAPEQRRELARLKEALATHPRGSDKPSSIDPEEARKLAALGYVGSGRTSDPSANPRDRIAEIEALRKGIAMESTATPAELVEFYRAVVARNPDSIDARGHLGAALERVGRDAEAEREYREALSRQPLVYEDIALALSSLQLRMGKLAEAEAHARLALGGQKTRASQLLARIAMARRDYAAAEASLGDPDADPSLRSYVVLAQIRANQGRIPDAIALLEGARARARERGVDVELMLYALGDLYFASRRAAEAETAFREEIRAFPGNLHAWVKLAQTLSVTGRQAEAEQTLRDMVSANPGARSVEMSNAAARAMRARGK